ncbi:hypothetical protein [Desulfopila sp. IMCC35008]|uniref:hypothetical protein n=1 Tax=Desulfopila sp. IMCC35008 TaxID=2653858 RepID=UPI0013D2894A|nr:hypothetical protein [Desulfopila sp. IMCC35008]
MKQLGVYPYLRNWFEAGVGPPKPRMNTPPASSAHWPVCVPSISMIAEDDGSSERAYPIAQYIANLCGGAFVPLPPTGKQPDSELMEEFSNVLKETGEAIEATRKQGCTARCKQKKRPFEM